MLKTSDRSTPSRMTTPKDRPDMGPIEVITSVQRRRRWSLEEKRAILEEGEQPGNSLSEGAGRRIFCDTVVSGGCPNAGAATAFPAIPGISI